MKNPFGWPRTTLLLFAATQLAASAYAQDSVASTPGNSDALSPYTHPVLVRYAVDLTRFESSWGNFFRVGPILKASADPDPLFSTLILGAVATSPDRLLDVSFPSTNFEIWGSPGAGVNPDENTFTNTTALTGFDIQFGVAINDFSSGPNNVIGALIGQVESEPARVYVTRWQGLSSRSAPGGDDTLTVSLGAIDADGNLYTRADSFNAEPTFAIMGDNVIHVDLPQRSGVVNVGGQIGGNNFASDGGSSTFVIDESSTTTNPPAVLPKSLASTSNALVLDFTNEFSLDGAVGTSAHLDGLIASHRGNPSFSTRNDLGGVGTVASLAKAASDGLTSSVNLFALDAAGAIVDTASATLPSPVGNGVVLRNVGGESEFRHYLSQTSFRGPSGQVAIGFDPLGNALIAAATATDPIEGDYIAVARFPSGQAHNWTIVAWEGKAVLDGPTGVSLGTLASSSPVSMSSPAADFWGNIYFIAPFQPTVGPASAALIKAVNLDTGYKLELILQEGDAFVGANSSRTYTIDRLTLEDSDSVASGSVFAASVMPHTPFGASVSRADEPQAFGGIAVNATIIYNNAGMPEEYQATLFIGPDIDPNQFCEGDADGDGEVDFADITKVLENWLNTSNPGSAAPGDANNDGNVNFSDITAVLGNWLRDCP